MNEIGDIELFQKHGECFKYNNRINGKEVKEGFDFYKWLNMSGMCDYISSDEKEEKYSVFKILNNNNNSIQQKNIKYYLKDVRNHKLIYIFFYLI